jgi:hypothetical protein
MRKPDPKEYAVTTPNDTPMNGAESLVKTLLDSGLDTCFTNPGTSEMHFVAALDHVPGMRSILVLQEGVATGAADGYFRLAGKPACTLLHLGPGLANGLSNLHNAKKAGSGVVNIVGEHAVSHIELDAPLTSDIEGIAAPVSHWVHTSLSSTDVGADAAKAVHAANVAPGQVAPDPPMTKRHWKTPSRHYPAPTVCCCWVVRHWTNRPWKQRGVLWRKPAVRCCANGPIPSSSAGQGGS